MPVEEEVQVAAGGDVGAAIKEGLRAVPSSPREGISTIPTSNGINATSIGEGISTILTKGARDRY